MTGARAPTALIDHDQGVYAQIFTENLKSAHHAFTLKSMDETSAMNAIRHGNLVAIIMIPPGFTDALSHGQTIKIKVIVDNIDTDMTDDIQRAIPSAIICVRQADSVAGIQSQVEEADLIDHDTDFIPTLWSAGSS